MIRLWVLSNSEPLFHFNLFTKLLAAIEEMPAIVSPNGSNEFPEIIGDKICYSHPGFLSNNSKLNDIKSLFVIVWLFKL